MLGEHTRQILTSLGYEDDRIESLLTRAAISDITGTP
jgi:crotonobetainyl-CoA:carnitine CoA-transferase CaiB-like acyl-CoA transferase